MASAVNTANTADMARAAAPAMQNARAQPPTPRTWACIMCTRSHQRAGRPHPNPPHKNAHLELGRVGDRIASGLARQRAVGSREGVDAVGLLPPGPSRSPATRARAAGE